MNECVGVTLSGGYSAPFNDVWVVRKIENAALRSVARHVIVYLCRGLPNWFVNDRPYFSRVRALGHRNDDDSG